MLPLNLESFKEHLKSKNIKFDFQNETNQILILNKIENVEYPLFIRLIDEGDLVQLLLFFPTTIKEEALNDLARSLHFINKELDMPGFGIDEKNKLVYFRTMIPCSQHNCDPVVFDKLLNAVQMIGKTFLPLVASTSQGLMSFSDVQQKLTERMQKESTGK